MKLHHLIMMTFASSVLLTACDSSQQKEPKTDVSTETASEKTAAVLPYLNIQEQPAKLSLPFCETKNCMDIHVQTIHTVDPWLNTWIEQQQAMVIQDQIGLKQVMNLQQAIDRYIQASDAAQGSAMYSPFDLELYTRIPYQRNQYVLLQIGVNSQQNGVEISDRNYFFVADRKTTKPVRLLEIIEPKQQVQLDQWIQQAYQTWRSEQTAAVQKQAPQKLYWGQADWFFDQQGLGLHYRSDEIVQAGKQLDIYLTPQQTQQVLKVSVHTHMF